MQGLDPRLHAFRPDLADSRLKGDVTAERFTAGVPARVVVPVAALHKTADQSSERQSECLFGEELTIFEETKDFGWAQSRKDGYVGYIAREAFSTTCAKASHRIIKPRSFQYAGPDLRSPMIAPLSIGSNLNVMDEVETRGTLYALLDNGFFVVSSHIADIEQTIKDYVAIAESLIYTPYLWGGASGLGIDCSGLVQLSMMMAGKTVLRDTDMQSTTIGREISRNDGLKRGDLVFWKGHVAIMADQQNIIHANGASMDVKVEPLDTAIERIARLYAQPTCYRRPD